MVGRRRKATVFDVQYISAALLHVLSRAQKHLSNRIIITQGLTTCSKGGISRDETESQPQSTNYAIGPRGKRENKKKVSFVWHITARSNAFF